MAITALTTPNKPGLLQQHVTPPPLLPKPTKDNVKLQKLLKKAAKKKAAQAQQPPPPFRCTLSPVSEASPDLEHSEHSTPPKTPESAGFLSISLPPRFFVKSRVQHVPSPYPKQKFTFFSKTETFSTAHYGPLQHQRQDRYTPPPLSPIKRFFTSTSEKQTQQRMAARTSPKLLPVVNIAYISPDSSRPKTPVSPKPKTPTSEFPAPTFYDMSSHGQGYTDQLSGTAVSAFSTSRAKTPTSQDKMPSATTNDATLFQTPASEMARGESSSTSDTEIHNVQLSATAVPLVSISRAKTPTSDDRTSAFITSGFSQYKESVSETQRETTPGSHDLQPNILKAPQFEAMTPNTPSQEKWESASKSDMLRATTPVLQAFRAITPGTQDSIQHVTPKFGAERTKTPPSEGLRDSTSCAENVRPITPKAEGHIVKSASKEDLTPYPVERTISRPEALSSLTEQGDVSTDPKKLFVTMISVESVGSSKQASSINQEVTAVPKPEAQPKIADKVKPLKTKLSGWTRLKKHMVVEPEIPQFPLPEMPADAPKTTAVDDDQQNTCERKAEGKTKESRATKMWDAVLYQMLTTKEAEQVSPADAGESKLGEKQETKPESRPFIFRLPLLLYKPRFDARKLKEAAAKPMKKITAIFEMGLLHRKTPEEEPKDFNRSAKGWHYSDKDFKAQQ